MKKYIALCAALLLATAFTPAQANNIALGAPVTANGTFGVGGWNPPGTLADFSSVTDGIILPAGTQWDQNTVWWDERERVSFGNSLVIDLPGNCWITGFTVQADDNDAYLLEYWDGADWATAWDIPAVGGWGMQTRDTTLGAPIQTSAVRFSAVQGEDQPGDLYYSVSEIQVHARCVPDAGSTFALLASVLIGAGALGRRFRA